MILIFFLHTVAGEEMHKILVMRQSGCIKEVLLYRDAVVPYILFVANNDMLIQVFTSCLVDEKESNH